MLDQKTKRKIDNARDILVGKVPDPKSQVEQITIALIYKFMDDMDKESEEWGGKATFFSSEYEKYAWSKIFDPRMGGHEITALYGEAIDKMNHNPNIPQLFRDIFKNAYLPYRDPETLKSFLKQINEFTYDHSERLGDAYEYLLSIMSKQGDAGQFRTPRHIIDFIVAVVDPKKNETVLDPACGTAGFLISSYKHIMKSNMKDRPGDQLTPEEKERLLKNFSGYDISPDMVRLSLVNLYLHGFSNPHILEYDTLTSEERWNETADVILANPPFMSPKGGIRPHKRFSIQAKRSEVLFVDYIAEHLNPNGRAGVIVPEGIIFQSGNAYKNLRKMLIENYLWAVVSLPAGIFQPYSGVKTSILLMDKSLAKRTNKVLFVKVENDGFDLGAQRKPIDKNDLPKALEFIRDTKAALSNGKEIDNTAFAHLIEKAKIAESGDWNLSGERYMDSIKAEVPVYSMISFEDTINNVKYTNKIEKSEFKKDGKYPIIDQSKDSIAGYWNDEKDVFRISKPVIIFGDHTRIFKYVDFDFVLGADGVKILEPNDNFIPKFYYYLLRYIELKNLGYSRHYKELKIKQIPLPPLDIQKAIVEDINGYQKIIDGAQQVVDNYKPIIKIDPKWEIVLLDDICEKITDGSHNPPKPQKSGKMMLSSKNIFNDEINFKQPRFISEDDFINENKRTNVEDGDILLTIVGTIGRTCVVPKEFPKVTFQRSVSVLKPSDKIISKYLSLVLRTDKVQSQINNLAKGVAQKGIYLNDLKTLRIPLPPLSVQNEIVTHIEKEQEIVNSNKKLIEIYEQKIKDKITEVWGD